MFTRETRVWYSTLAFAHRSWLSGVARLLDWRGSMNEYNVSPSPDEADYVALASDWYAIGDDLRRSMLEGVAGRFGEEHNGDGAEYRRTGYAVAGDPRDREPTILE